MATFSFPRMFNRDNRCCILNKKASTTVAQSLHLLILSCYGELLGDPGYGTGLPEVQFDRINSALADILKMKILASINRTLGALEVQEEDIKIVQDSDSNTVHIYISYGIKNTTYRNLYKEDITNGNE